MFMLGVVWDLGWIREWWEEGKRVRFGEGCDVYFNWDILIICFFGFLKVFLGIIYLMVLFIFLF